MLCSITSIHDIAAKVIPSAKEVFPRLRQVRKSTVRATNIEAVDFPRRSVVMSHYRDYPCQWPSVLCFELERALVLGDGVIIYNGSIIAETIPAAAKHPGTYHGPVRCVAEGQWDVDDSGAVETDSKPKFCASRYGIEYYGHWLVELLPRLKTARDSGLLADADILFPATYNGKQGIWRTVKESAASLSVDQQSFMTIPSKGMWVCNLRLITPLGSWGSIRPEAFHAFDEIRHNIVPLGSGLRLYVTRADTSSRRVSNEAKVLEVLSKHGFQIVYSSSLSFTEQVALFSAASVVCGPLGSALSNIVFSPEQIKIIALVPEKWDDIFFFDLASCRGQDWYEVRGPISTHSHKLYHRNDLGAALLRRCAGRSGGLSKVVARHP